MAQPEYNNYDSFVGKTRVILILLGIFPFLIVIYLFVYEKIHLTDMMVLLAALVAFFILTGFGLLRRSADQLVELSRKTGSILLDKKNPCIEIEADQELNDIADNFNLVLKELKDVKRDISEQSVQLMTYSRNLTSSYQRIQEEEELRKMLTRYVGENLVEKLMKSKDEVFLENERMEVTILFADIRSFSTFSERMEAEEVVAMLNRYFSTMSGIIFKHNGILDKFIGDQIMAVFGLIPSENNGSYDAIRAAIEMQDTMEKMMQDGTKGDSEIFDIGIGINTGTVIVGSVGSESRKDHTVIGDSVNVAARLEKIAGGGEIIVGKKTHSQTEGLFRIKEEGKIYVKNKIEPVVCYKVLR
ncbi:MAG: adenylate/guanylate cyclase domain-containing protein [Syntrophales bacterium]|nr:adenylate/guanylate cyclase domain-containing protein [Syntrophales bacterium]